MVPLSVEVMVHRKTRAEGDDGTCRRFGDAVHEGRAGKDAESESARQLRYYSAKQLHMSAQCHFHPNLRNSQLKSQRAAKESHPTTLRASYPL